MGMSWLLTFQDHFSLPKHTDDWPTGMDRQGVELAEAIKISISARGGGAEGTVHKKFIISSLVEELLQFTNAANDFKLNLTCIHLV